MGIFARLPSWGEGSAPQIEENINVCGPGFLDDPFSCSMNLFAELNLSAEVLTITNSMNLSILSELAPKMTRGLLLCAPIFRSLRDM